ncbi:MAG TPA: pyridoxal phosphate-dependent aminotransferase [Thermodesulfobacteriota bacterium]|nr:pyridoxal phosphate-dependent aminotransferase [Thermodesulfobacteriota bacterium]
MISKRSLEIPSFLVMDILERAHELERKGSQVIHLEVGEPDFETPECIKQAGIRALQGGKTRYTPSQGLIELREALADHYRQHYGVRIDPQRIIITMGSSPAMFLLFSALLERGDAVVLTNPYYACYPNIIRFLGGEATLVAVHEENDFQYEVSEIAGHLTPSTKAILINSPANPTGTVLSASTMQALADFGRTIISDEIYHGLIYGAEDHSILEFTDNAFVLGGFSKRYAMTGWRLGYLIVPEEFIRATQKIQQNFFISAGAFVQWAGVAALKEAEPDVQHMREVYCERRNYIVPRLRELGFGIAYEPQGAFYVLADARRFSRDSRAFAFDMLEKIHVAVTPGIDFGSNAEGYLRFSYANSLDTIREGMSRLETYLRSR